VKLAHGGSGQVDEQLGEIELGVARGSKTIYSIDLKACPAGQCTSLIKIALGIFLCSLTSGFCVPPLIALYLAAVIESNSVIRSDDAKGSSL
jgi:hypothetical protein